MSSVSNNAVLVLAHKSQKTSTQKALSASLSKTTAAFVKAVKVSSDGSLQITGFDNTYSIWKHSKENEWKNTLVSKGALVRSLHLASDGTLYIRGLNNAVEIWKHEEKTNSWQFQAINK